MCELLKATTCITLQREYINYEIDKLGPVEAIVLLHFLLIEMLRRENFHFHKELL